VRPTDIVSNKYIVGKEQDNVSIHGHPNIRSDCFEFKKKSTGNNRNNLNREVTEQMWNISKR
jgi:hypothetical protein